MARRRAAPLDSARAMSDHTWDYVIVGSGFGGSVSALRLTEKGYRVLVLERGRRFDDADFARTSWNLRRYLWAPALRCFGILQISPFRDVFVLHGAGVGGGSLGYANVLMEPDERMFAAPAWSHLAEWRSLLRPHYETAKRMLGVVPNPRLGPADHTLQQIAQDMGAEASFRPVPVGTFFGEPGVEVPDPYFGGAGLARSGCIHCGACMVGCRYNAKNTLPKNYLWLAERRGAVVRAEREVRDIRALEGDAGGARFEVVHRSATSLLRRRTERVRARNVIVSAGALGTMRLLFRCRDETRSLPHISRTLGTMVRTNSEALMGSLSRDRSVDYSKGIAITSIFEADPVTTVEPVRYPAGSSVMRYLSGPLIDAGTIAGRVAATMLATVRRPLDFLRSHVLPGWAQRTTILLIMQTTDHRLRMRLGRGVFTLFRRGLVSEHEPGSAANVSTADEIGRSIAREFAARTNGIPAGSLNETLLGIPMTAHILGGCPIGKTAEEGVVDTDFRVHGHPGLYVVDGAIMPANPGVNPSLSIAALAEYAMSRIPPSAPHDLVDSAGGDGMVERARLPVDSAGDRTAPLGRH